MTDQKNEDLVSHQSLFRELLVELKRARAMEVAAVERMLRKIDDQTRKQNPKIRKL